MCDAVVLEQRHLTLARWIGADCVLDPEGVDDVRFHMRSNFRPVESEQGLVQWLVVIPGDGPFRQPLERVLQGIQVHRFDFRLDDEPSDGIEVDSNHPATQPERLDHRRSATHERIEHDLARGIRVVTVISVKLLHEIGGRAVSFPGRLQRPQQDCTEHAGGPSCEPLVHLIDGLEAVALRPCQAVDLDDGEPDLNGTWGLVPIVSRRRQCVLRCEDRWGRARQSLRRAGIPCHLTPGSQPPIEWPPPEQLHRW